MSDIISLRQMQIGQSGRIATVEALGEMGRRIRDMGLIPGTTVSIVGRAPLKDPVALRLSGVTVTLRNSEADHITVDVSHSPHSSPNRAFSAVRAMPEHGPDGPLYPFTCANGGTSMNNSLKYGLFFLGGLALGVVGTVAVTRGKLDLKPLATDLVSRGMDMKDAIMSKVEAVREDMEDLAAEARQAADKRKAEAADPQA